MFKNVMKGMMVGAAALALAGTAHAATININLYGASAQHLFWNDMADDFLRDKGCTAASVQQASFDPKQGITKATCGSDTVYIRYASKASFDGIQAVKGSGGNPDGCANDYERKMVNEATCNWTTGSCTALKCVEVTLGASDVAGSSFTQKSYGKLKGHVTSDWVEREFDGIDDSGLDFFNPNVVPFGFFANNSVTKTKCLGPDPTEPTASAHKAVSTWGYQCYDPDNDGKSADCIGYYKCVGGKCSGGVNINQNCSRANQCPDVNLADTNCQRIPLDNISRLQAVMIFSGQAWNWKWFGDWYPDLDVVACLRHAGSGTHSTMDWAVMRSTANDWGWPMLTTETTGGPTAYFNDGSSDLMKCVSDLPGAIGYADADQLEGSSNILNVHALKYNGVEPRRTKIRNGEYDFYSNQWLYGNPARTAYSTIKTTWIQPLMAFAANPSKIPASKAKFWATQDEMWFNKSNDSLYPGFIGPLDPQLP